MKKVTVAVGVAVLAVVVAAFLVNDRAVAPGDGARNAAGGTTASSVPGRGSLTPEAVLAIAPRRDPAPTTPARAMAPSLQQFYRARSYGAIYARLKSASARTPEDQWMLAEILTRCAKIADDASSVFSGWRLGSPGARERFVASIAPNDPDRDKRIAAFDAINYDACADIGDTATLKDIRTMLEAGASGGDPKARVALVLQDLEDQIRGPDGRQRTGSDSIPHLSDAQLETLRQAMASGDPLAMRSAASLLLGNYQNVSLRDADDRPVDSAAFLRATILASCEYGYPCGPDSDWVLHGCAMNGNCAAHSLRDYMMYYNSSPSASQVTAAYEAALRNAVRGNDWSFFHFYAGPNPATAAYRTRSGP